MADATTPAATPAASNLPASNLGPLPALPTQGAGNVNWTQGQVGISGGSQLGTTNNQQQSTGATTGTATGEQSQANVYTPEQQTLAGQAETAAGNYITTGAPPPGVTGADQALVQNYTDQFNQNVAPEIAAAQGAGSAAIGSELALGLEQQNAAVYGTNLSAYQNSINQGGTLGLTPTGITGVQGQTTTGTSEQAGTSNTQQAQEWQQAMADLTSLSQSSGSATT